MALHADKAGLASGANIVAGAALCRSIQNMFFKEKKERWKLLLGKAGLAVSFITLLPTGEFTCDSQKNMKA